jgi:predicted DsbA family dithiol-disulfide isomerase
MYASRHPDAEKPAVRWLPFQLNPHLPPEGMPRADYLERKFGNRKGAYERVAAVGKTVGIPFAFDRITVQPNTVNPHRLLTYAERAGRQDEMAEALFLAYFTQGADLSDSARLGEIAAEAGLDASEVAAYLSGDEDRAAVLEADSNARNSGMVDGVPFFMFSRKVGVPGAQDAMVLLDALEQSLA